VQKAIAGIRVWQSGCPTITIAQLVTLYMAGHEPTASLVAAGTLALLRAPDQMARLQAEIVFMAILDRTEDLELASTPEWGNRMFIRGLNTLRVSCTIRDRKS
jgi:cytochrome P450